LHRRRIFGNINPTHPAGQGQHGNAHHQLALSLHRTGHGLFEGRRLLWPLCALLLRERGTGPQNPVPRHFPIHDPRL
jgi:hypothetical protein